MTSTPNPATLYAAELILCVRHPSRRAAGYCERCAWDLCRACLFSEHRCRPVRVPSPAPRRLRRGGLLLAGGAVLLAALALRAGGLSPWRRPPAEPRSATPAAPFLAVQPAHPAAAQESEGGTPAAPPSRAALSPVLDRDTVLPAGGLTAAPDPGVPVPSPGANVTAGQQVSAEDVSRPVAPVSFDRGPEDRREVLFSFDAGAEVAGAEEILAALAAADVRTTFFLTGQFIGDHPELVRRLVRDGHEIGNHTDTHLHLTTWQIERRHRTRPGVDRARLVHELSAVATIFREITGREIAPLWRAPYGEINDELLRWASEAGWQHVGWTRSLDTLDWVSDPRSTIYRSADEIAAHILDVPRTDRWGGRGAIVLMHLGSDRPRQDRLDRVLPRIVEEYRRLGFEFVTASAMMRDS